MPPECEDCDLYDDAIGTCPYMNIENYCYKIALVKKCTKCGKAMCKVQGAFKKEETASHWDTYFCCSKECAKELQDKLNEEDKMLEEEEEIIAREQKEGKDLL